ncbi:MAG: hypothetical protein ACK551_07450 [Vampirovibrionales bacterium]
MSINALPPNRFTPSPQQARLNPQVAQQRQGVTFPKQETRAAFKQLGQIMHVVGARTNETRPIRLYGYVRDGLKALIGNKEDSFTGLLEVVPDLDEPHLSRMVVSLERSNAHLGKDAEPSMHKVELSPTSDPDAVQTAFDEALASVIGKEKEIAEHRFNEKIGNQVSSDVKRIIDRDVEELFGEKTPDDDTLRVLTPRPTEPT